MGAHLYYVATLCSEYKMSTNREIDENGFMLIKGCPISSFGIFDYSAGQLGLPGDPNRIVKVYRPESAVSDPDAIRSFTNVPLINDHEMLSGFEGDNSTTAPEDYGVDGVLTSNVYYEAPWMRGDLKVFSREMQADLSSGKKDLSLGYSCEFEVKPGIWNGQAYEVVQTKLRGNHIALVREGRVPGARVLDGLCFDHLSFLRPSDEETAMKRKLKKGAMDNAVAQLKALIPALEQFLSEEATEPAHQEGAPAAVQGAEGDNVNPDANAAAAAAPVEGENGAASEGGEAGELQALIGEVKATLAKLEAMAGGSGADEGATNAAEEGAADNVEGLATNGAGVEGAKPQVDNAENGEQGKASPGPAAGTNATANDAALRGFYADLAAKTSLYNRLSKVVGTFDHAAMDSRAVASYGVKKLNLRCKDGHEVTALEFYLSGAERQSQTKIATANKAADAAAAPTEVDSFLRG